MRTMYEINQYLYSLPHYVHYLMFAIIVALYAHLWIGYTKVKNRLKPHVKIYFVIRFVAILTYVFLKSDALFDLFLPMFIISYIDGLIIIKSFSLHRCQDFKSALKHIMKFNSTKNGNKKTA